MDDTWIMEETVGEQKKRVAVAIGRFNPPTTGHYKVLDRMKIFTKNNPGLKLDAMPVVVVIEGKETSKDLQRNPLTAEERIAYMKASGRANGVRFLVAGDAFSAFEAVRKEGMEPIAIAAGSDRVEKYLEMLNRYFKTRDDQPIEHIKVPGLERAPEKGAKKALDQALADLKAGGELDDAEVSGSMARAAVESGFLDEFAQIVGLESSPQLAQKLFDLIKTRIEA